MDLLLGIPSTLIAIGAIIVGVIFGLLWLIGLFDKVKKQRDADAASLDDRVIKLLKEQVDALEKKVNTQEKVLKEATSRIHELETRNRIIEDIFQGRDQQTLEFQKKGFEVMSQYPNMLAAIQHTNESIQALTEQVNKHVAATEQILAAVNKK